MPYVHLPENHKEFKSLWVNFPNKFYDPEKGHDLYQRYLSELVLADQLGYRRDRRQRASQLRLQHDADAESDRGGAHPANQELQDLRLGHAAQFHAAEPAGRGIRDARRDVEGTARGRLPARHRHGILVEPGEPGDRAREIQGVARRSSCRRGPRTGPPRITANSTPTASSIRGRGPISGRIRPATSSAPAARKRSRSRPSSASATRPCS